MKEENLLNDIFGNKWKAKSGKEYVITWCDLCDCVSFWCREKDCHGSTCNGGGCNICGPDQNEFDEYKRHIRNYISKEELKIYEKCLRIRKFMLETITKGEKQIDFKKLKKDGCLSRIDEEYFSKELE